MRGTLSEGSLKRALSASQAVKQAGCELLRRWVEGDFGSGKLVDLQLQRHMAALDEIAAGLERLEANRPRPISSDLDKDLREERTVSGMTFVPLSKPFQPVRHANSARDDENFDRRMERLRERRQVGPDQSTASDHEAAEGI